MRKIFSLLKSAYKLYGNYRYQILVLVILGFVSGLFEGIGVSTLVPLFSYITDQGLQEGSIFSRVILGFFSFVHLEFRLRTLLLLMVILFILKACIEYLFEYLRARIVADYEFKKRSKLYEQSLRADWSYLLRQKIGYIENVLMTDVAASVQLLTICTSSILHVTSLIMYVLVALTLSKNLALLALGVGFVIVVVFKPLLSRIRFYSQQQSQYNKDVSHQINEGIIGLKTFKSSAVERSVMRNVATLFERLRGIHVKQTLVKTATNVTIQPISVIFIGAVFSISFLKPGFDLPTFIAVTYMIQRIFIYVDKVQGALQIMNQRIPHAHHVLSFQDAVHKHREIDIGRKPFVFEKELSLDNITFAYENNEKSVFSDLSFSVRHGETVGIIGPSGVGKTTIADMLLRLFKPSKGTISLDGVLAQDITLDEWRTNIVYVSQDIFLKNDTIKNNIRFFDESITQGQIEESARMAQIHDFIETLPEKFETIVGDRGIMLSAGQRQRVVLARALARKPKILILDEATSALDNESEEGIRKAIESLHGEMTTIIIAHRLATVRDCDRLIVISEGVIKEQGSPEELLGRKGSYFERLYSMQQYGR